MPVRPATCLGSGEGALAAITQFAVFIGAPGPYGAIGANCQGEPVAGRGIANSVQARHWHHTPRAVVADSQLAAIVRAPRPETPIGLQENAVSVFPLRS